MPAKPVSSKSPNKDPSEGAVSPLLQRGSPAAIPSSSALGGSFQSDSSADNYNSVSLGNSAFASAAGTHNSFYRRTKIRRQLACSLPSHKGHVEFQPFDPYHNGRENEVSVIKLTGFRMPTADSLSPTAPDLKVETAADQTTSVWVRALVNPDIDSPFLGSLVGQLQERFDLHDATVSDIKMPYHLPKMEVVNRQTVLIVLRYALPPHMIPAGADDLDELTGKFVVVLKFPPQRLASAVGKALGYRTRASASNSNAYNSKPAPTGGASSAGKTPADMKSGSLLTPVSPTTISFDEFNEATPVDPDCPAGAHGPVVNGNNCTLITFHEADLNLLEVDAVLADVSNGELAIDPLTLVIHFFSGTLRMTRERVLKDEDQLERRETELIMWAKTRTMMSSDMMVDLFTIRRRCQVYKRIVSMTRDVIVQYSRALDTPNDPLLVDVRDNCDALIFLADSVHRNADEALHLHMGLMEYRTNRLLYTLTIFSVVFIPITFLVGLYGVNFHHMPELDWKYAYYVFLVVLLGTVFITLTLLRRFSFL